MPHSNIDLYHDPERRVVVTEDGSHSVYSPFFNQTYHSRQGAVLESNHIFIDLGLRYLLNQKSPGSPVAVLEIGFGTALNPALTWITADKLQRKIAYTGIEAYPVSEAEARQLDFGKEVDLTRIKVLHESHWGETHTLSDFFSFQKIHAKLEEFESVATFDVIYFDAFAPESQPELWTQAIFQKLYNLTNEQGCLVTYSSKGIVRRALTAAGYRVEKHPGPGRKREVVRAVKEAVM